MQAPALVRLAAVRPLMKRKAAVATDRVGGVEGPSRFGGRGWMQSGPAALSGFCWAEQNKGAGRLPMPEGRTVPDKANVDNDDPCDAPDRGGQVAPLHFWGSRSRGLPLGAGGRGKDPSGPAWNVWTRGTSADLPRQWGQRLRLASRRLARRAGEGRLRGRESVTLSCLGNQSHPGEAGGTAQGR